jgi:hypothetical protein
MRNNIWIESDEASRSKKRRKSKKGDFQPTREYIDEKTREYLKNGGEIKKITAIDQPVVFTNIATGSVKNANVGSFGRIPESFDDFYDYIRG